MDYNKDDINEKNNPAESNQEYESQFVEVSSDMYNQLGEGIAEEYEAPAPQKKEKKGIFKYIHPSIFIAICVFVAALLAFGIYNIFFVKTIEGSWVYEVSTDGTTSTADEAESQKIYYEFGKTDNEGVGELKMSSNGAVQKGEYQVSTEKDVNKITIGGAEYTYVVEGIKLFGNATLKLTMPESTDETTGTTIEAQTVELKQTDIPDFESDIFKDYKTDSKLTASKWSFSQNFEYYGQEFSYSNELEFQDNGILKIIVEQNGQSMEYNYAYTVTDKNKLKLRACTTTEEVEATYTIKGDELSFNEDSMFGSNVFYKDGKQPETTVEDTTAEETTAEKTTVSSTKAE